jgi:hypothetical protein
MKEEKQHAEKCASKKHKYYGDARNIDFYAKQMEECDCDGYHTFDELYDHRITLYICLCEALVHAGSTSVWRSKRHSDGELPFGTGTQYILGIGKNEGSQITYHIPIERWEESGSAETLEKAPEWDKHTSDDVLKRLKSLINQ